MTDLSKPLTRIEQYLAGIAGVLGAVPETPLTRIEAYLKACYDGISGVAAKAAENLAAAYDPEGSYTAGDYVTHEGTLYMALADSAEPAGEWVPEDWEAKTVTSVPVPFKLHSSVTDKGTRVVYNPLTGFLYVHLNVYCTVAMSSSASIMTLTFTGDLGYSTDETRSGYVTASRVKDDSSYGNSTMFVYKQKDTETSVIRLRNASTSAIAATSTLCADFIINLKG